MPNFPSSTYREWGLARHEPWGTEFQVLRRCAPEFRVFVEAAERQLLSLFQAIDRDKDGRLNKQELQAAFRRAGLSVPGRRLAGFFDEIDLNNDGYITFDEWR